MLMNKVQIMRKIMFCVEAWKQAGQQASKPASKPASNPASEPASKPAEQVAHLRWPTPMGPAGAVLVAAPSFIHPVSPVLAGVA